MSVEQVQGDWDVVVLTPVWHRDCALAGFQVFFRVVFLYLNIDEVPLLAIVESKFVLLGGETLVVVEQGLNLIN